MNTSKLSPAPWTAKKWQGDEYRYNWQVRDYNGHAVVSIATEADAKAIAALPKLIAAASQLVSAISLYCCENHISESDLNEDCPELLEAVDELDAALREALK